MSKRCAAGAGLLAVALLIGGCGTEGTANGGAGAAPVSAVPAGLEAFYTQELHWGSCAGYSTDGSSFGRRVECAKVQVPVDYARPDGDEAQIAVARSKAKGDRIGSILVNPGGPGSSGLAMASEGDGTDLADHFDMVGFDPRGIGASTPRITCLTAEEIDRERQDNDLDMSPAGIAATESENQDYARRCATRSSTELLAHVGTYEVVRDMDIIRAALGDEKLNYLGFSYGTRLGSSYAETFPRNVRAMVLDGALDPQQNPVDEVILQAAGFQEAFEAFVAECAAMDDCPLGRDPGEAVTRFRALVDPLVNRPAMTTDPRGLSYSDAITGVQQALYSPNLWAPLRGGLASLADGNGDALLMLADLYEGRSEDGSYSNINDAFNAIRCMDDPPTTDRAVVGAADVRFREVAPFLDDGRGTGNAPLDICAFWPVPHTGGPHAIEVDGLPPLVVISTTEDPATPYQAGVELAKQLGASLITYRGTQHTVALSGEACVDDAVVEYFLDPLSSAAEQTC